MSTGTNLILSTQYYFDMHRCKLPINFESELRILAFGDYLLLEFE